MNDIKEHIRNYMYIVKDGDYAKDFYELCLKCIQKDHTVLFITRKPYNMLPLLEKIQLKLHKEHLQKFVIMYFQRIEDIIDKLLRLHDWSVSPALLVIDINAYLPSYAPEANASTVSPVEGTSTMPALQCICFCIATLFNYMGFLEDALVQKAKEAGENVAATKTILGHSIVLLGEHANVLSQEQLQLLVDLYFYDECAFADFDAMIARIMTTRTFN